MRKFWNDSIFGDGPRQPLDRNGRARFDYLLDAHHRAGRLTRATRDVGRALLKRLGTHGQCDPCHATLAGDAACHERTVLRACNALRALGLLFWQRRLVRDGSRVDQTSNAYALTPPAGESERLRDRHFGAGTRKEDFISVRDAAMQGVEDAMKGCAAILRDVRRRRERALGIGALTRLGAV